MRRVPGSTTPCKTRTSQFPTGEAAMAMAMAMGRQSLLWLLSPLTRPESCLLENLLPRLVRHGQGPLGQASIQNLSLQASHSPNISGRHGFSICLTPPDPWVLSLLPRPPLLTHFRAFHARAMSLFTSPSSFTPNLLLQHASYPNILTVGPNPRDLTPCLWQVSARRFLH